MFCLTATRQRALQSLSAIALACSALAPSLAQAPGDLRIALVIGNAAYAGNAALTNPTNDAKAMGDTLRSLGFTVVEVRDGSKAQMTQAIANVKASLQGKQAIGMLYYAGHGLQVDWRNYMVPIDAKMTKASEVPEQTVDLSQVIDAFKTAGNRMNIVVLDACRDNPFGNTSTGKGLAQLDAPPGTFLAYATAPGNVAEDGDTKSANGLYTQFLLQELKKPAAKIEDVFKRVRLNVRQQSQGRQIPWESTSLEDDFYFDRAGKTVLPSKSETDVTHRLQLTLWESLKNSQQSQDIAEYLKLFPSGFFSELAQFRLDQLTRPNVVAVARPEDKLANTSLTARAYVGTAKEIQYEVKDDKRYAKFVDQSEVFKIDDQFIYYRNKFDNWGKPTDVVGTLDLMGNPISSAAVTRSVPVQITPAEYKVGYRWKYTDRAISEGNDTTSDYESRITAKEIVKTKIGDIEAFRIETKRWRSDGANEDRTRWVVPGEIGTIKQTRRMYRQGRVIFSEDSEIVSFKSGKPTA